jgi:hypothetical protein
LYATKSHALQFGGKLPEALEEPVFQIYSDASFGDDSQTRRSSNGYVFKLYRGAIDWQSCKQRSVATSTTEAELNAISTAARAALWWKRIFEQLDFDPLDDISINCDNQQTIRLLTSETPKLVTKLRHIDIQHHWLREHVQTGELKGAILRNKGYGCRRDDKGTSSSKSHAIHARFGPTDP